MKKVRVIEVNNYVYTIEDTNKKKYNINIEFIDNNISIGDIIYMPNEVLMEKNIYTYGPIENNTNVDELIKIVKDKQEIYLQRYYG